MYILKYILIILSILNICHGRISQNRIHQSLSSRGGNKITNNKPKLPFEINEIDRKIIKTAVPTIANFAINPLVGSITLYYVGKMKNTLALAGMAAANQVYFSTFILFSYLPSITGSLVSTEHAKKNKDGVEIAICHSMIVGILVSSLASILLLIKPKLVLRMVLSKDASVMKYAEPYLVIRSLSIIPSIISSIGFASFRGIFKPDIPLYISFVASMINVILHPLFIFKCNMGVAGAALATVISEYFSAIVFLRMLCNRNMISLHHMTRIPKLQQLLPLLKGGTALQIRNVSMNIVFIYVSRVVQSLDDEGIAASAHSMTYQIFSIGGIVLLALSTVAQTLVPNELVPKKTVVQRKVTTSGGKEDAKILVHRMMSWGLILGGFLGLLQIVLLPFLHAITPIKEVQNVAKMPSIIASIAQFINGLVFIGEGVMIGCRNFLQLSMGTVIATFGAIISLQILPSKYGLSGVWMSFIVLNIIRLIFVYVHQEYFGPFSDDDDDGNDKRKNQKLR